MKIQSITSKQTNLFFTIFASLSLLFMPFGGLQAITIQNGMGASYVLGQSDFTSNASGTTISTFFDPESVDYDPVDELLFVGDEDNHRILIFDLSGGITNGMDASYVLGQPDFTSNASNTGRAGLNRPTGVHYETTSDILTVADQWNNRVVAYDLSGGITNGMNADYVLGQPDFTSTSSGLDDESLDWPEKAILDPALGGTWFVSDTNNNRIVFFSFGFYDSEDLPASATGVLGQPDFVSNEPNASSVTAGTLDSPHTTHPLYVDEDAYILLATDQDNNRILLYNLLEEGAGDGMDAYDLIGQPDFTSRLQGVSQSLMNDPSDIHYDFDSSRIFVADENNNRIVVYELSGEGLPTEFSYVLGQSDFTSNNEGLSRYGMNNPTGLSYDSVNERLFVSDDENNRILVFDSNGTSPAASFGSGLSYTHPPTCSANMSSQTIVAGEEVLLNWNTIWPTDRRGTYYVRVPGQGLYSSEVSSVVIQPQHTTTYTLAVFNLWGANFCEATITVLDENGQEITSNKNSNLTASAISSGFFRPLVSLFSKIFVR